jgi:hypothetical protein
LSWISYRAMRSKAKCWPNSLSTGHHQQAPRGADDTEPEPRAPVFTGPHWTLFFDGSSRKQGAGAGVVLLAPHGDQIKYMMHLNFKATNNMAEYEALLFGLSTTLSLGI